MEITSKETIWQDCQKLLNCLNPSNDPRIGHNIAVLNYYKTGCTPAATNLLLNSLKKIISEHDLNCIRYNTAILNFQLHHYSAAFDDLCALLSNIGSDDKALIMRAGFLLMDTCLSLKNLKKETLQAALEFVEKALPQLKSTKGNVH